MLTLQQYCSQFDDAVRKFTRRDICASEFPFDLELDKMQRAGFPPAASAMIACCAAGFVYTGLPLREFPPKTDGTARLLARRRAEAEAGMVDRKKWAPKR
jgi:hypothetical protein